MSPVRFGLSALMLTASAFALATPVIAQDNTATDEAGNNDGRRLGTVTVTAQRREETLIDVPLSVTALDGDLLESTGVADLTEIAKSSPNVTLEVSRGTNTTLTAFIRGVGQQDPVSGFEAGVGIYIDDVYLNRPQAAVLEVYDVERVEVLRGPQGTLYGRNTIGGAVKYVTKPLSSEPYVRIRVNAGTYSQLDGIITFSAPVSETFRVGASVASFNRAGFGENLINGDDNYNKKLFAARASAEWDASANFAVRFAADYSLDKSNARQGGRLIPDQFPPFTYPVLSDEYDTRAGLDVVEQSVEAGGGALTAEWKLSDAFALKSVTAYREDTGTSPIDFDSLPEADLDVPAIYENDQLSQEFLLSYTGERLTGVVGAYYLDAASSTVFDVLLANTGALIGLPGLNAQTFGEVETSTWSVYGDFTYDLTPQWAISLGGRYTDDERTSTVLRRTYVGGFSSFFGGNATPISTTSNFNGSATFEDFSPRVSVSYRPNDAHNLYVTYAQGFKGGSFDPRGQTTAAPDTNLDGVRSAQEIYDYMLFDPEEVDSYEVGAKSAWGFANTSVALFYMDYQNVQVPGSIGVDTNGDGINDSFAGVTTNAGAATLWGVEFEGLAALASDMATPGDTLDLSWSVGYINAEYDEFIVNDVNLASSRVIQNTPDWTAGARLTYARPLAGGLFSVIGGASYRGDSSQFEVPNPFTDQSAFTLFDLTLNWRQDDGPWSVALIGKNLTDERYKVAAYNFVTVNPNGTFTPTLGLEGTLTAFYGDPRTVTLGVTYEY